MSNQAKIQACELETGQHFKLNGKNFVWHGDEYDEDTLWVTEVETRAPFALEKFETVEI